MSTATFIKSAGLETSVWFRSSQISSYAPVYPSTSTGSPIFNGESSGEGISDSSWQSTNPKQLPLPIISMQAMSTSEGIAGHDFTRHWNLVTPFIPSQTFSADLSQRGSPGI